MSSSDSGSGSASSVAIQLRALLNKLSQDDSPSVWFLDAHRGIEYLESVKSEPKESAFIHPSATVHATAIVKRGCLILEHALVGPYCLIRGGSIVGPSCYLGYNVEVSSSILVARVKVSHTACIGSSIIGSGCNLSFGFVVATRRLREGPIQAWVSESETFAATAMHHGCAVGPRVQTGVNVSIMPGSSIGADSVIFPNSCIGGFLPSGSFGFYVPRWMALR